MNESLKTIVIIDDDKEFLYLVYTLLKRENYKVLAYDDAISFYKAYLEHSIKIDMIITDIEMPLKSGTELIYDLTLHCNIKNIPIIFLTGKEDDININNAFENNVLFLHYLLKPLNFALLLTTIHKMFMLQEYAISIQEANNGLLQVIKQLKEKQSLMERNIETQKRVYQTDQERLKNYLQELYSLTNTKI